MPHGEVWSPVTCAGVNQQSWFRLEELDPEELVVSSLGSVLVPSRELVPEELVVSSLGSVECDVHEAAWAVGRSSGIVTRGEEDMNDVTQWPFTGMGWMRSRCDRRLGRPRQRPCTGMGRMF